jgi:DNA-binding winged helix-turn-helix (wHTH) protein/TolB-like protein
LVPFRVDAVNRLLLREGEVLSVTPKAVDTLVALIQHGGEVLRKDDLMRLVWPDTVVEEGNLTQNIYLLRKMLGEGTSQQNYIETIPRRGYRFVGEVRESRDEEMRLIPTDRADVTAAVGNHEAGRRDEGIAHSLPGGLTVEATATGLARPPLMVWWRTPRSRAPKTSVLIAVALLLVFAALSYLKFSDKRQTNAIESIAILPFKPLGAASGDEDLGRGIADALITQLTNNKRIIVRPTSAVLKYGDSTQDLLATGRELGVDAILDGKFQRADGRLRVTVQLIRVRDGAPLWAEKFDEQFTSFFAVQDVITARVMRVMPLKPNNEQQPFLTENPEVYQAYLQGCYYLDNQTTRVLESSIAHFQQAITLDPGYAPAYAGMAECYALLAFQYDAREQDQTEAAPRAKEAANRALQLNDRLPEAHAALGGVKQYLDSDIEGAEAEYRRAIELNPGYAHGHHAYAILLFTIGRLDEARIEIMRAEELDPLSVSVAKNLGDGYYFGRQYDQAIEQYQRALKLDPTAFEVHRDLGWAYTCRGMNGEAATEFIEAMRLDNAGPDSLAAARQAYDRAGLKGYWRKWLEFQRGTHQSRAPRSFLSGSGLFFHRR